MDKELTFSITEALTYTIFRAEGEISVNSLLSATGELNKIIGSKKLKDLVIDLSKVEYIDSKGINLLVNLKKKIEERKKELYLLTPSEIVTQLLKDTSLIKVFTILESSETLDKQVATKVYNSYLPYTTEENGLNRLNCSCHICGSDNVVGYLIDHNSLNWKWMDDDPFPIAVDTNTNEQFDYFNLLPVMCLECYMTSIKVTDFNICSEDTIVIKSELHDESKMLLTKSIKRRKKIMENLKESHAETFLFPQERSVIYKMFELAEFCTRTISVLKTEVSTFDIGYLNYIIIRFAGMEEKEKYINNCRTWFTQALNSQLQLTSIEYAISYFALLISNFNLNKPKDAAHIFSTFTDMIKDLPSSMSSEGISSPRFWYEQAENIWNKEIEEKSDAMKI